MKNKMRVTGTWTALGVVALGAIGIGVAYATSTISPGPNNTLVGCITNAKNGPNLQILSNGATQCPSNESQIALSGSLAPQTATVDCGKGQSIQAALDGAPANVPLAVDISGTCHEAVRVDRGNVGLEGASGAEIAAPTASDNPLTVGGMNVNIEGLTLYGGMDGLFVEGGTNVSIGNSTIANDQIGILVKGGDVFTSTKEGGTTITNSAVDGVQVDFLDSKATLAQSTIENSGGGPFLTPGRAAAVFADNSTVSILGSTLANNPGAGVIAQGGANVELDDSAVSRNAGAFGSTPNGALGGVIAFDGVRLQFNNGVSIDGNSGDGVSLSGGSEAEFAPFNGVTTISNNTGDGLSIHDTSSANFTSAGNFSENNGGWGILCASSPSVAMITGTPGTVSGNGAGQNNCPTGP